MCQELSYFQLLSGDSSYPCYFVRRDTYELLYYNEAMTELYGSEEELEGNTCYEVLFGQDMPCSDCPLKQVEMQSLESRHLFHNPSQTHFLVQSALVEYEGQWVYYSKLVPQQEELRVGLSFEYAMGECAEILSDHDTQQIVNRFLDLLGRYYICDKTFVYELNDNENLLKSRYIWRKNQENQVFGEMFSAETVAQLTQWLEGREEFDVIELNEKEGFSQFGEMGLANFHEFSIDNITMCPLYNPEHRVIGFLGMGNCRGVVANYRLLKAVARFVQDSFNKNSISQELFLLTDTDPLTGFYNRYKYAKYVELLQSEMAENLGVLFVNLNGLKRTNEYFGFEVGDAQIKKVAELLKQFFSEAFYRVSGDEFICFVQGYEEDVFRERAERLYRFMRETENHSFSVGHAWSSGTLDIGKLVATADTVMYINKQEYYSEHLSEGAKVLDTMLQDLFEALERDEFLVYLQGKVDLETEEVVGAEALIRRFDTKSQKMIFPDQFIPLYEKHSIIRHLDLFVLRRVCQLLSQWKNVSSDLTISVNLSRVTLLEHNIVETFALICDEYDIPHSQIVVEVTERVGLIENDVASHLVEEFKAKGFKISLDDFGCAYSNIVTLAQIVVDEVKIDKSLVDHLESNLKNKIIVENMIRMINSLEHSTALAEGIEEQGQAELLRQFGCRYGQGYLYWKPMPSEEFYQKCIQKST